MQVGWSTRGRGGVVGEFIVFTSVRRSRASDEVTLSYKSRRSCRASSMGYKTSWYLVILDETLLTLPHGCFLTDTQNANHPSGDT